MKSHANVPLGSHAFEQAVGFPEEHLHMLRRSLLVLSLPAGLDAP